MAFRLLYSNAACAEMTYQIVQREVSHGVAAIDEWCVDHHRVRQSSSHVLDAMCHWVRLLGYLYVEDERFLSLCTFLLSICPYAPKLLMHRGELYERLAGRFFDRRFLLDAISDYSIGAGLPENDGIDFLGRRAGCHEKLGNVDEALRDYNEAFCTLTHPSEKYFTLLSRAKLFMKGGDLSAALEECNAALTCCSRTTLNLRGLINYQLGRTEAAQRDWDDSESSNAGKLEQARYASDAVFGYPLTSTVNIRRILHDAPQLAIEQLAIRLNHEPENAELHFLHASAWMVLGHKSLQSDVVPQAVQAFQRALDLAPRNDDYFNSLMALYERHWMYEEAIELLTEQTDAADAKQRSRFSETKLMFLQAREASCFGTPERAATLLSKLKFSTATLERAIARHKIGDFAGRNSDLDEVYSPDDFFDSDT